MSSSTRRQPEMSTGGEPSAEETEALRAMSEGWRGGHPEPAESLLARYPRLAAQPEAAVRLVYEEWCLREELGERLDSQTFYQRFPQWREPLQVVLNCHRMFDVGMAPSFPEAPGEFGEFFLLHEIDRGAAGRVFLATQPELSDRPLVVKLTVRQGDEHLSLARLQHSHIVPLYLVQDFADRNLRALCMPYLGGLSWARALERLKGVAPAERTGASLVKLLEENEAEFPAQLATRSPALGFLQRATYEQAVCWIGVCLADALHYAHLRGLVHLDIKPSNVLLAADGQPMLLDFHLALTLEAGNELPARLGGTRGYMSPEQAAAADALRSGRKLPKLDGRSDIYSLGLLLYESLGGQLPSADAAEASRLLQRSNPRVSRGLHDIIIKCLARNPAERYETANQLAGDLRRHLADLPLRGVGNRSLLERWQKWRRRQPHAAGLVALALFTALAIGGGLWLVQRDRVSDARLALAEGQRQLQSGQFSAATDQFNAGLARLRWVAGQGDLKRTLHERLAQSQRAKLADGLHALVGQLRTVDSLERVPADKLQELIAGCATIWQSRELILRSVAGAGADGARAQVPADLLDLVILWTELQLRLAGAGQHAPVLSAALEHLHEVERLCGHSRALAIARQHYEASPRATGLDPSAAGRLAPQTAWEHFLVGRWLANDGELEAARAHFADAVDQDPAAFWPHCYLAIVAYRLGQYDEAVAESTVCIALSPRNAACYYNRALARQALGQREQALADLDRAIVLDATLGPAALQRGLVRLELAKYDDALVDLENALQLGEPSAETYYHIARAQLGKHQVAAARASLEQALRADGSHAAAAELLRRVSAAP